MSDASIKGEAHRLVDLLPASATWEDLQYEIYVRQAVEAGLKDSREGRTVPLAEARRRLGPDPDQLPEPWRSKLRFDNGFSWFRMT